MKPNSNTLGASVVALLFTLISVPRSDAADGPDVPADPTGPSGALLFNGAGQRVVVPDDGALDLTGASFTLEAWVRLAGLGTKQAIASKRTGSTGWTFQIGSAGKPRLVINSGKGNKGLTATATGTVPAEAWTHVAVVSGPDETSFFINGNAEGTTNASRPPDATAEPLAIGADTSGSDRLLAGRLDALRIWNVARTQGEIRADIDRDLTVFDPSTGIADRVVSGLLAEWRFNQPSGNARDSSGQGRDGVPQNMTEANRVTDGLGFRPPPPLATIPTSALDFDGTAETKVTVDETCENEFDLLPALTVEAWVHAEVAGSADQVLIGKEGAWSLERADTGQIRFVTEDDGGAEHTLTSLSELTPGRWYHVAAVWDGATKRLFIDGRPDQTIGADGIPTIAPAQTFEGPLSDSTESVVLGGGNDFDGQLDLVRIWSTGRSEHEVRANRFCPMRGFEDGLLGEWSFDGATGAEDTSWGRHGLDFGAGATRTAHGLDVFAPAGPVADVPPADPDTEEPLNPGGGALFFPRGGSQIMRVQIPHGDALDRMEDAMTVETWLSIASLGSEPRPVARRENAWALLVERDPDNPAKGRLIFRTFENGTSRSLIGQPVLGLDRWHHVAAVFDRGKRTIVVDGEAASDSIGPNVADSLATPATAGVVLGGSLGATEHAFHGRLESTRLWSTATSPAAIAQRQWQDLRGTEEGLVATWRFNADGSPPLALNVKDASMHALHGMLEGTTDPRVRVSGLGFAEPPRGQLALALRQDGAQKQWLAFDDETGFDFTGAMTAELWVKLDASQLGQSAALLSKGSDAWDVSLNTNGQIEFTTSGVQAAGTTSGTHKLVGATRLEEADVWRHVAVVWDPGAPDITDDGTKAIYIDGVADSSEKNLEGAIDTNDLHPLVGARPVDNSNQTAHFAGAFDEVRIWGRARSPLSIQDSHARALDGGELGLVSYLAFSQGGRGPDAFTALDTAQAPRQPIDAAFADGMGILNRVPGRVVGEPVPEPIALSFDGKDDFVHVAVPGASDPFTNLAGLTLEAWVRPVTPAFDDSMTLVMKGTGGFGLALDPDLRLRYYADGSIQNAFASSDSVAAGIWSHVAVVVDRTANTTAFYINGLPAGSTTGSVITEVPGALYIGRQGTLAANHFRGDMDEVRVWSRARSPVEIGLFAEHPLPGGPIPGLLAYYAFNEGLGSTVSDSSGNGLDGKTEGTIWTAGHSFPGAAVPGGLNLTTNASAAGLWVGDIAVNAVSEAGAAVRGRSDNPTPTGSTAALRVLLHVAANGKVTMLKDVVIMQKTDGPEHVLVTRPELIPSYEGVVRRDGKLVGLRFGTVAFDFAGNELPLLGGIGPGVACLGEIRINPVDPTNPFRHKFHPDQRSGYAVKRQFSIQFDGAPGDPLDPAPGFGVDRITGKFRETITGLHKIPLVVEGDLALERISNIAALNGAR